MRRVPTSALLALTLAGTVPGCSRPVPPPRTALDDQPPRLVSAFFGLDHAMPVVSWRLCRTAPGRDGMPVTFSRRVTGPVDAHAFTVHTRSGQVLHPDCATTAPADGPAKNHTVLLLGELGRDATDPPVSVTVTGSLPLAYGGNARGLTGPVIPLVAGPSLALAIAYRPGAMASDCPAGTRQVVMAVWQGGVHPGPGLTQEDHRRAYTVITADGTTVPRALGDLDDRDNYVHLCLDTAVRVRAVSVRAGVLADPRGDLNPETAVLVVSQP